MKLTTHLHTVQRLRKRGATSYNSTKPYVFTAWCLIKQRIWLHGTVLSYSQGQLYLYLAKWEIYRSTINEKLHIKFLFIPHWVDRKRPRSTGITGASLRWMLGKALAGSVLCSYGSTQRSYFVPGKTGVPIPVQTPDILTEVFHSFPQYPPDKSRIEFSPN
jgi:hypothetical protein